VTGHKGCTHDAYTKGFVHASPTETHILQQKMMPITLYRQVNMLKWPEGSVSQHKQKSIKGIWSGLKTFLGSAVAVRRENEVIFQFFMILHRKNHVLILTPYFIL